MPLCRKSLISTKLSAWPEVLGRHAKKYGMPCSEVDRIFLGEGVSFAKATPSSCPRDKRFLKAVFE
jgi:hypothetical protein